MNVASKRRERAESLLNERWRASRDDVDAEAIDLVIDTLRDQGAISAVEAEHWRWRLTHICPGHERGRKWCAYCHA